MYRTVVWLTRIILTDSVCAISGQGGDMGLYIIGVLGFAILLILSFGAFHTALYAQKRKEVLMFLFSSVAFVGLLSLGSQLYGGWFFITTTLASCIVLEILEQRGLFVVLMRKV